MKHVAAVTLLALGLLAFALPATAADKFPDEAVTYSIPFNPGGQSDLEARRQQPLLEKYLGVDVIIQYKPGGGGSVGWAELMQQKPKRLLHYRHQHPAHHPATPWHAATQATRPKQIRTHHPVPGYPHRPGRAQRFPFQDP